MLILCGKCGTDITERSCGCRPEPRLSNLQAVVATAASMGGVTERTIRAAEQALRERAS